MWDPNFTLKGTTIPFAFTQVTTRFTLAKNLLDICRHSDEGWELASKKCFSIVK